VVPPPQQGLSGEVTPQSFQVMIGSVAAAVGTVNDGDHHGRTPRGMAIANVTR
jgi:hypothetical protein